MLCNVCGTEMLYGRDTTICPKCNNLKVLPKDIALSVVKKQVDWFDQAFYQVLKTFHKKRLIVWLLGEREKYATAFFAKPSINLETFLAMNALIKRAMKDGNNDGKKEADEQNTPELISAFSTFIEVRERYHLIDEGFAYYVYTKDFDINNLSLKELMSNFRLLYDEEWQDIVKTFGNNLIMTETEAKKYFEEHKEGYEKAKSSPPQPEHLSTEETISRLFPIFQTMWVALAKNDLFAKSFDLAYLKTANISPNKLLDVLKAFKRQAGLINMCSDEEFKNIIKKTFSGFRVQSIYKNIVFSEENQEVFPIFVKLDGDMFTSPLFTTLLSLYYYPVFYKDFFATETAKRGKEFEDKEIPDKFKSLSYKVHPPFQDKKNATLEIDGLAWKDERLYVIESKIWDAKPYFEHKKIHLHRERDLKGIVDGKKYTTKDGKLIEEDIPSLTEKIEFVKNNLAKLCPEHANIKQITGVIIMKSRHYLKEYNGVKIIAYDEIESLT